MQHESPQLSCAGSRHGKQLLLITRYDNALRFAAQKLAITGPVATSNWHVEQLLRTNGYNVIQLEELIEPESGSIADQFVQDCVRRWYVHQGEDFTLVDGISLGRIHEYDLLYGQTYPTEAFTATAGVTPFVKAVFEYHKLMEITRPSVVHHDLDNGAQLDALRLVASKFSTLLEAISPSEMSLGIQAVPTSDRRPGSSEARSSQSMLRLLGLQASIIKTGLLHRWKSPAIFLVGYHGMDFLARALEEHGYRVYVSGRFASYIDAHWQPLGTLGHWLRRLTAQDTVFCSRAIAAKHATIAARWAELKDDPSYRKRFSILGICCFDYFSRLFTEIIDTGFRKTLNQIANLANLYRSLGIRVVVVPFDEPNFGRLCVLTAQRLGIWTVVVQHGAGIDTPNCEELMTADHLCVTSQVSREIWQRKRPDAKVDVIGLIQLDKHNRAKETATYSRSADSQVRVLVLTQAPDTYSVLSRATDPEVFMVEVVGALNEVAEHVEVSFKLHPSEKPGRYEKVLAAIKPRFRYRVESGWTLAALLKSHDLLISPRSTGIAEALFLRKPVVYFSVDLRKFCAPFDFGSELLSAKDGAALAELLKRAVMDYDRFLREYDFSFSERYFGPQDGHAADRFVAAIGHKLQTASSR